MGTTTKKELSLKSGKETLSAAVKRLKSMITAQVSIRMLIESVRSTGSGAEIEVYDPETGDHRSLDMND